MINYLRTLLLILPRKAVGHFLWLWLYALPAATDTSPETSFFGSTINWNFRSHSLLPSHWTVFSQELDYHVSYAHTMPAGTFFPTSASIHQAILTPTFPVVENRCDLV